MTLLSQLSLALVAVPAAFALVFYVSLRIGNFGVVDVAWAGGFTPLAWFYALTGRGDPGHRLLMACLVSVWSLRLAWHLGRRVARQHPEEDGRYASLRREWAPRLVLKMGAFFVFQGLLLVLLSLPFALVCRAGGQGFGPWEVAALALVLAAVFGETLADAQLSAFKRDPALRGEVCRRGLWRWSRHPNYFFEWLVWIGFALAAMPTPAGWTAWLSPVLMFWFLTRVTGIRYTEERLLQSKGETYRDYQRRTNAFVPWPPSGAPTHLNPKSP